jgi:hypothetical protein
MANAVTAARAKGRCPECGRIISGRAVGIQRDHADRKFVALRPHNREEFSPHPVECLARGGYRKVPRIRDAA